MVHFREELDASGKVRGEQFNVAEMGDDAEVRNEAHTVKTRL